MFGVGRLSSRLPGSAGALLPKHNNSQGHPSKFEGMQKLLRRPSTRAACSAPCLTLFVPNLQGLAAYTIEDRQKAALERVFEHGAAPAVPRRPRKLLRCVRGAVSAIKMTKLEYVRREYLRSCVSTNSTGRGGRKWPCGRKTASANTYRALFCATLAGKLQQLTG